MKTLILRLLSGVVAAAVSALFYGWEYHTVARPTSGYLSLGLLSATAFALTILFSGPVVGGLQRKRKIRRIPLAPWGILAIVGAVFFSLSFGFWVFWWEPGFGSLCLGIAAGQGVALLCGAPQKPTKGERRLLVGYGILLVALGLGRPTIQSILVPYADREAAQVAVQKAAQFGRVGTLKRALENRDPRVRRDAALALGRLGPDAKPAVEALVQTLRAEGDSYRQWEIPETRQAAAEALGQIGPSAEPAVPALIEAMQDKRRQSLSLRRTAAASLGRIGKPVEQVVAALAEVVRSRTPGDWSIVEPAIRALGRIGPGSQPAIPTLLKKLESPSTIRVDVIRQTLVQIGPTAVAAAAHRSEELLTEMGRSDVAVRLRAGMALRNMGPLALPTILRSLQSDNPQARIAAARGVSALNEETQAAAVVNLSGLLGDPEPTVRLEAALALIQIGPAVKPAVTALLDKSQSADENGQLRDLASHVLKQIDFETGKPQANEQ